MFRQRQWTQKPGQPNAAAGPSNPMMHPGQQPQQRTASGRPSKRNSTSPRDEVKSHLSYYDLERNLFHLAGCYSRQWLISSRPQTSASITNGTASNDARKLSATATTSSTTRRSRRSTTSSADAQWYDADGCRTSSEWIPARDAANGQPDDVNGSASNGRTRIGRDDFCHGSNSDTGWDYDAADAAGTLSFFQSLLTSLNGALLRCRISRTARLRIHIIDSLCMQSMDEIWRRIPWAITWWAMRVHLRPIPLSMEAGQEGPVRNSMATLVAAGLVQGRTIEWEEVRNNRVCCLLPLRACRRIRVGLIRIINQMALPGTPRLQARLLRLQALRHLRLCPTTPIHRTRLRIWRHHRRR